MTPTLEQTRRWRYLQAELAKPYVSDDDFVEHNRRVDFHRERSEWVQDHLPALIANTERLAAVRAECERIVNGVCDTGRDWLAREILSIIDAEKEEK